MMFRKHLSGDTTESRIDDMNKTLDNYSSVPEEDREANGTAQQNDVHTKAVNLAVKARKLLCDAGRSKVTLEDPDNPAGSVGGTIEIVQMGRRRAGKIYNEVDKEPKLMITWVISIMLVSFLFFLRAWIFMLVYIYNLSCVSKLIVTSKDTVYKVADSCGVFHAWGELVKLRERVIHFIKVLWE
ncbi:uncharacterized protein [Palaemon carinicauda]|uniref:uncharacterized protein n=1 Tax=Palaemon carinicauda TaxID=392227 RepID=UPI0035B5733B